MGRIVYAASRILALTQVPAGYATHNFFRAVVISAFLSFGSLLVAQPGPAIGPFGNPVRDTPMSRAERTQMFLHPAVMGDSLTQGFYGAVLRPDTQDWAFPMLVQREARLDEFSTAPQHHLLNQNLVRGLFFDIPAALPLDQHGHAHKHEYAYPGGRCGPVCIAENQAGTRIRALGTRFPVSASPVSHVGIAGADFYSAMHANEACVDLSAPVRVREIVQGTRLLTARRGQRITLTNPANSAQTFVFIVPRTVSLPIPTMSVREVDRPVRKDGTVLGTGIVLHTTKEVELPFCIPVPWNANCVKPTVTVVDYPIAQFNRTPQCIQSRDRAPWVHHGLRNLNNNTQMDQIEEVRPSFLMAVLGNNHVLWCVLGKSSDLDRCLDFESPRAHGPTREFENGIREFQTRVSALLFNPNCNPSAKDCGRLRGGILGLVPDVAAIPFLKPYNGPGCSEGNCMVSIFNPDCADPSCFFTADQLARVNRWKSIVNERIVTTARDLGFAVFDADRYFTVAKSLDSRGGWPISTLDASRRQVRPEPPLRARMSWPNVKSVGVFGLDGIHPNALGHALLANAIINELNHQYRFSGDARIPNLDEVQALAQDPLNQHPVDLEFYIGTANELAPQVIRILRSMSTIRSRL